MLSLADFDEVYNTKPNNVDVISCKAPECFIGSYPPVAPAGQNGDFFVNTYLLQPNRAMEVVGTVKVRSGDLEKCRK